MKKYRTGIVILILLSITAGIIFFTQNKSSIKKDLRDFAVEDTSSIDKIFMVDKTNQQVLLERINGVWMVNGKYAARKDAIDILLKTINRIDVKSPVPNSAFENVVKSLATLSTKVEIYQNNELTKTYYVGGATRDNQGTYMMLEDSSTPFIVTIQGFNGYLSTRYFLDEVLWRNTTIFNYRFEDIASITLEHPMEPEKSFKITRVDENNYVLEKFKENIIANFDTIRAKEYFSYYKRINFEALIPNMEKKKQDSLNAATPKYIFTVEEVSGIKKQFKAYLRKGNGLISESGKPFEYDPDKMYGVFENGEFTLIQYHVFDPLLKEYNDFIQK
ncbi:MAG TPA: hypothetical protein DDX39_03485 [Bacteroidales bacterium]|nr:MAG: hypothetical protein A2W98_12835 [Bacteroidetes bacterium GWF2_33_38]OFY69600.1 MAG: hypothetical protein A2265_01270 [Bacteroidetes bacterium RIFOXYA12_FULL_33_9]OFY86062.1 MAG: hypothetical protein A2236_00460 [Bacteroidetes bacterium RIFOXYA2_FULL_33_7]HBF87682.1 hypothetical protein [Bacteroidales bacterium]